MFPSKEGSLKTPDFPNFTLSSPLQVLHEPFRKDTTQTHLITPEEEHMAVQSNDSAEVQLWELISFNYIT